MSGGNAGCSLALSGLTSEELRMLVRSRLGTRPGDPLGDHLLNPDLFPAGRILRAAAVLIPLVERADGLNFILTKRGESLTSHSGQIAFPGGKVDPGDKNARAAALREADEEIALNPDQAEIIGRLPDYHTGSGFRIAPFIAVIDPAARLKPNPAEVDYIFEVPLHFLMNPCNHHRASRMYEGRSRHFFEMPYGKHYIWGITAGILHVMYERLFK